MKKMIVIAVLLIGSGIAGFSQDMTPRVDARQRAERSRIHEGRASGELTRREAAGLNAQQRHIRKTERRAKSDGTISRAERQKLHREQNRASRNIKRQKHDNQSRKTI